MEGKRTPACAEHYYINIFDSIIATFLLLQKSFAQHISLWNQLIEMSVALNCFVVLVENCAGQGVVT